MRRKLGAVPELQTTRRSVKQLVFVLELPCSKQSAAIPELPRKRRKKS